MYKVIPITLDNIHEVKRWAIQFMETLGEPCDADYYESRWIALLKSGSGIGWWLVIDGEVVGGIGGIVAPDILCGQQTMIELFWYIAPQYRRHGLLVYREMEKYVKKNNLKWAMIHMERSMPEKLKDFYIKQGFKMLETHWVRYPTDGRT